MAKMSWLTYPLSKPITAHGQEVEELVLIAPSTKDIRELGYPFMAKANENGDADMELRADIGAKFIARLAKIPMSSVDQIHPGDFMALHGEICGFFGDSTISKTAASTSRTSGE